MKSKKVLNCLLNRYNYCRASTVLNTFMMVPSTYHLVASPQKEEKVLFWIHTISQFIRTMDENIQWVFLSLKRTCVNLCRAALAHQFNLSHVKKSFRLDIYVKHKMHNLQMLAHNNAPTTAWLANGVFWQTTIYYTGVQGHAVSWSQLSSQPT